MASRGKQQTRTNRESDSMEAVKPLVVLVLFGTILYGGYCVVQKGPSTSVGDDAAETMAPAPAFVAPALEVAAGVPAVTPAAVAAKAPNRAKIGRRRASSRRSEPTSLSPSKAGLRRFDPAKLSRVRPATTRIRRLMPATAAAAPAAPRVGSRTA